MSTKKSQIIEMRKRGFSYKEIAKKVGSSYATVKRLCSRLGLTYSDIELLKSHHKGISVLSDDEWKDRVSKKWQGQCEFVKVAGIGVGGEARILIRCTRCQEEREVSAVSVRHPNKYDDVKPVCKKCQAIEAERNKEAKQLKTIEKKRLKEVSKPFYQLGMNFCSCGQIIGLESKKCDNCKKRNRRETERRKETVRRLRCKDGDWSISLEKLFERDQGLCYLCNQECDWNDYIRKDNAFIVGNTYPTIEHIIPLSKGGKHSWNNVRLACFKCNTMKGDKIIPGGSPRVALNQG